jgi:hypothetical protein
MASAKQEIDWERFADLVAMLDASEGEASNAVGLVVGMARRHGLTFVDAIERADYKRAIWRKCRPPALREWIEWKDGKKTRRGGEAEELRERVTRLEESVVEEGQRAARAEQLNAELEAKNAELIDTIGALQRASGVHWDWQSRFAAAVIIVMLAVSLWAFVRG